MFSSRISFGILIIYLISSHIVVCIYINKYDTLNLTKNWFYINLFIMLSIYLFRIVHDKMEKIKNYTNNCIFNLKKEKHF